MDVSAVIDAITDDAANIVDRIDLEIHELELKLEKLQTARRVMAKVAHPNGQPGKRKPKQSTKQPKPTATADGKLAYWDELEQKIYDLVNGTTERLTCSDIGEKLGLNFSSIGRAINKSHRLDKEGSYIVVVS